MSINPLESSTNPSLFTESISGGLRGRRWRSFPVTGNNSMLLVVFGQGKAQIDLSATSRRINSRHLLWCPQADVTTLTLGAATDAVICHISLELFQRIISAGIDAANLKTLQAVQTILELDVSRPSVERLDRLLHELGVESVIERGCDTTAKQAITSLVLITLWRLLGSEQVCSSPGTTAVELLQSFRHLLEQHFRSRWSVANYASELGINSTALYDLCKRKLGHSPSKLIEDRTLHEAKQLLVRSQFPVSQVARVLGFSDSAYFSRFFSHHIGVTATQFRKTQRDSKLEANTMLDFSDWP